MCIEMIHSRGIAVHPPSLNCRFAVTQRWPLGFPFGSSMSVELEHSYKVVTNHGVKVGVYVPTAGVVDLPSPQEVSSSLSL